MKPDLPVPLKQAPQVLLRDLRAMIESAREQVARAANAALTLLYWNVGRRIRQDILKTRRAEYGKRIVSTLSTQLVPDYGEGFGRTNLLHMMRFAEAYPSEKIVHALCRQLGWSHFRQIIYIRDPLKRGFYAEMGRLERWSTRTLAAKIRGMLYERTALSKKPAEQMKKELALLRQNDSLTPDLVFRDPYVLDFLGLKNMYSEKDLEAAILRELEGFLIELGTDFTFVGRQKRMTVGKKDRYLDLLFFHRRLRCLIALELKLADFEPAHMGQMEFYLRWLEKYEMRPGERPPIGLVLCAGKEHEDIELLQLDRRGIRIVEYLIQLPSRKMFKKKLHDAIRTSRERFAAVQAPKIQF